MTKVGRLELYVGGMFAEKSTTLVRQGNRHLLAGRKVVFLKPAIDKRYDDDFVVTHDGQKVKALNVKFNEFSVEDFTQFPEVIEADVVCIDEIQFFPEATIQLIERLVYQGKKVYCSGLDLDKFGRPFGIVPTLMAKAEHVEKFHAVCADCGDDAWVTVQTKEMEGVVNIGNDYRPVCRQCSVKYIGGAE
jgi:thymidine kinase